MFGTVLALSHGIFFHDVSILFSPTPECRYGNVPVPQQENVSWRKKTRKKNCARKKRRRIPRRDYRQKKEMPCIPGCTLPRQSICGHPKKEWTCFADDGVIADSDTLMSVQVSCSVVDTCPKHKRVQTMLATRGVHRQTSNVMCVTLCATRHRGHRDPH